MKQNHSTKTYHQHAEDPTPPHPSKCMNETCSPKIKTGQVYSSTPAIAMAMAMAMAMSTKHSVAQRRIWWWRQDGYRESVHNAIPNSFMIGLGHATTEKIYDISLKFWSHVKHNHSKITCHQHTEDPTHLIPVNVWTKHAVPRSPAPGGGGGDGSGDEHKTFGWWWRRDGYHESTQHYIELIFMVGLGHAATHLVP